MRFSTKEDISAPIDAVFAAVTDFERFERQGLRRGADIQRKDPEGGGGAGLGSEWRIKVRFRGKERKMTSRIVSFDAPNGYRTQTKVGGLDTEFELDLVALSPNTTRMSVAFELQANTLAARLLVQSLKFAKGNLTRRFTNRVWQFAQTIEERYGQAQSGAR